MSTIDEIRKSIDNGVKFAVIKSGAETRYEIMKVVDKFYSWRPDYYVRTLSLRNSLTQPELISDSPNYKSKIYFDTASINYTSEIHLKKPLKFLTGEGVTTVVKEGPVNTPVIVSGAMEGSTFRNWKNPTKIWKESETVLDAKAKDIIKKNLKKYLK